MKKGFTLVELLVVIILLAALSMIVYPKIVDQIEKKSTTLEEKELILIYSASDEYLKKYSNIYSKEVGNKYILKVDDLVKENLVAIDIEGYDEKCVIVTIGKTNSHEIGDCGDEFRTYVNFQKGSRNDTYLGILYLDPTNLDKVCTEEDVLNNKNANDSLTNIKVGCMRWYVYKEEGENYIAILDHNAYAAVAWNSSNVNTSMNQVATALTNCTSGWNSSLSPRLITAAEIADITGNKDFDASTYTSENWFYLDTNSQWHPGQSPEYSKYYWLYDHLYESRNNGARIQDNNAYSNSGPTANSVYGYWTSTATAGGTVYVWRVSYNGRLDAYGASNFDSVGVRPVITVSKSIKKNLEEGT